MEDDLIFSSKEVDSSEIDKLRTVLLEHYMFNDFDQQSIDMVIEELIEFTVERDRTIFEEDDEGSYFYIVRSGLLEHICHNEPKLLLSEYTTIGEIALIQKCRRKGTLRSISDAEIFVLEGSIYREVKKKVSINRIKMMLEYLENIPILKYLTTVHKNFICNWSKQVNFTPDSHIVRSGEVGDSMYIIKDGLVSCRLNGLEIKKFQTRDYFGELSLLFHSKRSMDVLAVRNTTVFVISKKALEEAIGLNYKELIVMSMFRDSASRDKHLMNIVTESNCEEIFKCFGLKRYKAGDTIYDKEKDESRWLIMIIEGDISQVNYFIKLGRKRGYYCK